MSTIYILILYMWVPSTHAGGGTSMGEFSSKERCEAAATAAAKEFDGFFSKTYHVCVQK